jgi:hypothetical protein
MATATVPNAGTFDLEVDTGFVIDGFTLDSATKGLLDSTSYVLDGTTTYASITTGVISANINRGRRDPLDPIAAGMFSFVLNDTLVGGLFGPFDTSSPYYDDVSDIPGLAPGRAVRFTRYDSSNVAELLFVGTIVNYDYNFALGGLDTVTVFCADGFYKLANTFLTAHNPTKEFTGTRINAILDRPEVAYPTGAARDIAAGTVELGGGGSYAIPEGTNVKAYFDDISYSAERGRIFLSRAGVLVSQDRTGTTLSSPTVQFSDSGDTPYNNLGITFQAENILNRVAVTPAGGTQQVAEDLASQAEYFVKSLYINRSLLHDNAAALTLADYLLFPEPEPRFDAVDTFYGRLTAAQRDACAIVDLGDTIEITKNIIIGGTPTARTQELSVEGLEHRIGFATGMTSRYYTAPTTIVVALILDDVNDGILDTNALA